MAINTNNLLDAISIVSENIVKKYKYDQTIEAKVISTARKSEGIYKVEYENGKFDAYTQDTATYYENEVVYVMVPMGDFTKQKYIIGRKVDAGTEAATYNFNFKMPFDRFVGLEDLTHDSTFTSKGYLANKPEHGCKTENEQDYIDQLDSLKSLYDDSLISMYQNILSVYNQYHQRLQNSIESHYNRYGGVYIASSHLNDVTTSWTTKNFYSPQQSAMYLTVAKVKELEESVLDVEKQYRDSLQNIAQNTSLTTEERKYQINQLIEQHNERINELQLQYTSFDDTELEPTNYEEAFTALIDFLYTNALGQVLNNADTTSIEFENMFDQYLEDAHIDTDYYWTEEEYNLLKTYEQSVYDKYTDPINKTYSSTVAAYNQSINDYYEATSLDIDNKNFLWKWDNENPTIPLAETKLGISANFKTLLSKYRPARGKYGLRIELKGKTRPTEEEKSVSTIQTLYFTNEDMYGNTYGFYEPTIQQKIFDISNMLTLESIRVFFWQDHDFWDVYGQKIPYENIPSNIQISNLSVLLGLTTDECTTDRVFLYTYDDIKYGTDALTYTQEYSIYQEAILSIQNDSTLNAAEKSTKLKEITNKYAEQPGYEWLLTEKTLKFAWVHLTNAGAILITHYSKKNDNDLASFEYWEDTVGAKLQWYHYEYGCLQDTSVLAERQGGLNWKYLESTTGEDFDTYIVTPNASRAREQWKAIVTVNDVPYETEPLIFTNVDSSIETSSLDSLNEITFRLLRAQTDENGITNIIEDNSLRDFYVYDENNYVLKDKDNIRYNDYWYYVQVWIRNNDTGNYSPMTYDPDDNGVEVNWQPPTSLSMIDQWAVPTDAELSNSVLAPILEGASSLYNDRIRAITRKFKIKSYLDLAYLNNTIGAIVTRKGKTYHPQIELHFGQAGSMGSQYTIVFTQLAPEGEFLVQNQKFSIVANVVEKGKTAEESQNSKYIFSWECLSPTIITESAEEELQDEEGNNKQNWTVGNGSFFIGNKITGYLRNDMPPVFKVTVLGAADYVLSNVAGFKMISDADAAAEYSVSCPNRVEFKSDGSVPLSNVGTFSVTQTVGQNFVDVYPTWELIQYKNNAGTWNQLTAPDYLALKETPIFSQAITTNNNYLLYYAKEIAEDGSETWIFNREPFSGSSSSTYVELEQMIQNEYNATIANALEQDIVGDLNSIRTAAANLRDSRFIDLSKAAANYLPGHIEYSLDPYKHNTTNDSPWYWDDNMKYYYTILKWTENGVTFKQAIPFSRNLYSSSLLNSWDGKLTIDEAQNAVLAQMISAGAKDNNNAFTGVIMGNWSDYGDTSLDVPGIYGLEKGGQVFGFRTDGTGFIGKSGRGQIVFNGNQSLISNVDKTAYINLDPITYNISSDGSIDLINHLGYSQYFLYAEAKKSSQAPLEGVDSLELSTAWANKFLNDETKDYFIVDPNNGVLTSGGIIARYGKIGNWMISNQGLYQKHTGNTLLDSRYMYLGYSTNDLSELTELNTEINTKKSILDRERERDLTLLYLNYLQKLRDLMGSYYAHIFQYDPEHYYMQAAWADNVSLAINEAISRTDGDMVSKELLESLLIEYFSKEERTGTHFHWHNGQPSLAYIGGAGSAYHYVINALWSDSFGSNNEMRTYYYADVQSADKITLHVYRNNNTSGKGMRIESFNTQPILFSEVCTVVADTYYGSSDGGRGDPNETWRVQWQAFGAPSYLHTVLDTSHDECLSVAWLTDFSQWARAYYNYHLDGYTRQYNEMLAAGAIWLKENSNYDEYYVKKKQLDAEYNQDIKDCNSLYNDFANSLDQIKNKRINEIIESDTNKYAIFAGYAPNTDPLFSVNWRGYMTARAGRIGTEHPWYISDQGLTQTNNFGTIFLGNPEARSNKTGWSDDTTDLDVITLLPNDKKIYDDDLEHDLRGPLVLGASEESASYGGFAIYAGTTGQTPSSITKIWEYDEATNEYKLNNYTTPQINFGVRMDGTLYAAQGKVGGWYITKNMMYAGSPSNPNELLVLDAQRGVIALGTGVLLSKTGEVYLGTLNEDGTSAGKITIAGFEFLAQSYDQYEYDIPTYTAITDTENVYSDNFSFHFWGVENASHSITITPQALSAGTVPHEINPNGTLTISSVAESGTGISIISALDNLSQVTVMSPLGDYGILGTSNSRWHILGDYITCNTLDVSEGNLSAKNIFMNSQLVATEQWVKEQLNKVYAAIKSVGGGGSGGSSHAGSVGAGLGSALNNAADSLADILSGPTFMTNGSLEHGTMTFEDWSFAATWAATQVDPEGSGLTVGGTGGSSNKPGVTSRRWVFDSNTISVDAGGTDRINKYLIGTNELTIDGTTLKSVLSSVKTTKYEASCSLSHTHEPTFSITGSTVKLTIGDADFSKTTSSEASFDMKDTTWFKSLKVAGVSKTTTGSGTVRLQDGDTAVGGASASQTVTITLSGGGLDWNKNTVTRQKVTAKVSIGGVQVAAAELSSTSTSFSVTVTGGSTSQKYDSATTTYTDAKATVTIKTSAIPTTP